MTISRIRTNREPQVEHLVHRHRSLEEREILITQVMRMEIPNKRIK
jgi:hypothetical protein